MKRILGILCFVLLATLTGKAQDLKGTWTTLNGTAQLEVSTTKSKAIKHVRAETSKIEEEQPVKAVFEEAYFFFTFKDGSTMEGAYGIIDGVLYLSMPDRVVDYIVKPQEGGSISFVRNGSQTIFNKVD